ncbi:MAG: hypothetical protein ACE5GX_14720 [Thermoanaerobaculia bacterium]
MTAYGAEKVLTWLLRILGVLTLTAMVPMVMPTDWMASTNDWLGLDPFHRSPLTEYLTRSLSAVYALFGALTLYVSRDVRRYADFIGFSAILMMVLGVLFTVLDFWAGMPASWSWTEGPPTVLVGFWMLWLARRVANR